MPGHCYGDLCWCGYIAPPRVGEHRAFTVRKLPEESHRPGRQSAKPGASECFSQPS